MQPSDDLGTNLVGCGSVAVVDWCEVAAWAQWVAALLGQPCRVDSECVPVQTGPVTAPLTQQVGLGGK